MISVLSVVLLSVVLSVIIVRITTTLIDYFLFGEGISDLWYDFVNFTNDLVDDIAEICNSIFDDNSYKE